MKRHNPTRKEKETLTHLFVKGLKMDKLPALYANWPEAVVQDCHDFAQKKVRAKNTVFIGADFAKTEDRSVVYATYHHA